MSLDELNEYKQLIVDVIDTEKKSLIDDVEELERERETNEFLKEIASDYKRYHESLVAQKKRQQEELMKILDYLDSLLETQAVTKYTLSHTQNEQKRVINEIKQLQKDMDNIILE